MKGISGSFSMAWRGAGEIRRKNLSLNPIVKAMQRMGNTDEQPSQPVTSTSVIPRSFTSNHLIKQQVFHGRFLQHARGVSERPSTINPSSGSYSSLDHFEAMTSEEVITVPNPALEVQTWLAAVKDSVSLQQIVTAIRNSSHFQSNAYQILVSTQAKEMANNIEQRIVSIEAEKDTLTQEDAKVAQIAKQISEYKVQLNCLNALAKYFEDPAKALSIPIVSNY